jgi:hypothetical protein
MPIPILAAGLKLAGPWLLSKLGGLFGKKKTPEPVKVKAPPVPPPAAPGIPLAFWLIGGGVLLVLIIIIIVVVAGGKR